MGTWPDRAAWLLLLLGLALLLLPQPLRFRLTAPLQTWVLAPLRALTLLGRNVARLNAENQRLSRIAAELAVENARLLAVTEMSTPAPSSPLELVRSPVINRDLATQKQYLIVSRGSRHGVRFGAPVLVAEGIVGRTVSAGEHQSLVQTILNPDSRVAVANTRSRLLALARGGKGPELVLDYVPTQLTSPQDTDFRIGDTLVTAGLGDVFPRDLGVGTVTGTEEKPAALFKSVRARPFADIARLDQVFILRVPDSVGSSLEDGWLDNLRPAEVAMPEE